MGIWIATVSLKSSGKCAGKSEKQSDSLLEPTFSPVNTNGKRRRRRKKRVFKDGSDCNQKGRGQ